MQGYCTQCQWGASLGNSTHLTESPNSKALSGTKHSFIHIFVDPLVKFGSKKVGDSIQESSAQYATSIRVCPWVCFTGFSQTTAEWLSMLLDLLRAILYFGMVCRTVHACFRSSSGICGAPRLLEKTLREQELEIPSASQQQNYKTRMPNTLHVSRLRPSQKEEMHHTFASSLSTHGRKSETPISQAVWTWRCPTTHINWQLRPGWQCPRTGVFNSMPLHVPEQCDTCRNQNANRHTHWFEILLC